LQFPTICFNMALMKIIVNGTEREFGETLSLNDIVTHFCKENNRVIGELNGTIVKNPRWNDIIIKDGDRLELVSFVGGG